MITSKPVTITPEEAERMLTFNACNRPVTQKRIDEYAAAMTRGEWKANGETIIISKDGYLLNGQHRLLACVEAEVPFPIVLVCGVEREVFDTIDQGKPRTTADVLAINGTPSPTVTAAGLRLAMTWELTPVGQIPDMSRSKKKLSTHMMLERAKNDEEAVSVALRTSRNTYVGMTGAFNGPALFALYYHLAAKTKTFAGHETRELFYEGLKTGGNLDVGDARLALRNWCIAAQRDTVRRDSVEHLATYIWQWNNFAEHKRIKLARGWKRDNVNPNFPVPKII